MKRLSYDISISKDEHGAVEVCLTDRKDFTIDDIEYKDLVKSLSEGFTDKLKK